MMEVSTETTRSSDPLRRARDERDEGNVADRARRDEAFARKVQTIMRREGLSVREVAARTGMSHPNVYRLINLYPTKDEEAT